MDPQVAAAPELGAAWYVELATAFVRGHLPGVDGPAEVVLAAGRAGGLRLHKFKRNAELPRVRAALGVLRSLAPVEPTSSATTSSRSGRSSADLERDVLRVSHTSRCDHLALLARADISGRVCADQRELLGNVELFADYCQELGCWDRPYPFASDHARVAWFRTPGRDPTWDAYDDTRTRAILLSGLPASGKDHWLATQGPDWPVVSLDAIRAELGVDPGQPQPQPRPAPAGAPSRAGAPAAHLGSARHDRDAPAHPDAPRLRRPQPRHRLDVANGPERTLVRRSVTAQTGRRG